MSNVDSTQVIDRNGGDPGPDNSEPQPPAIEIAGYTLESRLGVGGYGEVWKAIGPGGLPKAIKILFGQMDGPQADAELKSLERMRDLRHPFLLSVERIEVVNGRLVVVTELADGCLEKRFQALRSDGVKGVPREELLGYLRDTADALDFMLEEHGLQHLDIKPENLLLQGKHVKVGDFGLAKDVSVTNMSLVGGFTPLYAPPEIFEGQPSRTSDQYSLAIVYQTMLTGIPPFSGRTAAQLTAQHLRSTPDLSSLQPVDRPVIARALSKNPSARFPSCRQFIDELTKRRNSRTRTNSQVSPGVGPQSTKRVNAAEMAVQSDLQVRETVPLEPAVPRVQPQYRPTLYVGVGGLGGQALRSVRKRFNQRFGDCAATAFPMLYVDSDRSAVAAMAGDDSHSLGESELLPMPLRTANEYRNDKELSLEWLSRRWLFNLPRSGEVEGIRPLGRLALVDHAAALRRRLKTTLKHAMSDESLMMTRDETNLSLATGTIDVVVVGSISGGTGSGAILDVANEVRAVIEELQIEQASVVGVLLHATSGQRDIGDIQQANAISCLKELKHYRTAGLEQADPFDHAYVVQLGDSLTSTEFGPGLESVADYVFKSTATPTRGHVDHWRELELSKASGNPDIRTFGMASVDNRMYATIGREANSLCYALAQKWTGQSQTLSNDLSETRLVLQRLALSEARLSERVMSVLRGDVGKEIETWSKRRWTELTLDSGDTLPPSTTLIAGFEESFQGGSDKRVTDIMQAVINSMPESPDEALRQLQDHVNSRLDQPGRISSAAASAVEVVTQLESSLAACERLLTEIDRSFTNIQSTVNNPGLPKEEVHAQCHQYSVVRFYRGIYNYFVEYVKAVLGAMKQSVVKLTELRGAMMPLAMGFMESGQVPSSQPDLLVEAFDTQVLTNDSFHLSHMLIGEISPEEATALLKRQAEAFMLAKASGVAEGSRSQKGFPESAEPELFNIGGGRRVLAMLPAGTTADAWMPKLTQTFGDCVSHLAMQGEAANMTVLCEVQGVSIETLLNNFKHQNPRLMEVASRVHTRVDINW